jgi:hypothetical protein
MRRTPTLGERVSARTPTGSSETAFDGTTATSSALVARGIARNSSRA